MAAPAMETASATALRSVLSRVHMAAERAGRSAEQVRVVAVSKTKSANVIQQVYNAGHRVFGENYVQELTEKAPQLPSDIQWHFIGNLQSNKVKALLGGVPNLHMVESVDDKKGYCCIYQPIFDRQWMQNNARCVIERGAKGLDDDVREDNIGVHQIANHLDRAVVSLGRNPLKILVQVNTSGEESKHGVEPSQCVELVEHVRMSCPNLIFSGLMTIGMLDYSSTPENFNTLRKCRTEVCDALGIPEDQCELSMGMSADFEQAIQMGSTNVRIGSIIFGPREYPKKNQCQEAKIG